MNCILENQNSNSPHAVFVVIAICCVGLFAQSVLAQTETTASISWTEPALGTQAVQYIVQVSTNAGPWETAMTVKEPRADLTLDYNMSYRVRIAGVDTDGVQGPFSVPSEAFNPSTNRELPRKPNKPFASNP